MSRIDFYHLQKQNLEAALPKLLEKAYASGKKIKVQVGNELRVEFINSFLWTYNDESFLPHGTKKDGAADAQPIWISAENDNPNQAEMLFLVDGAQISAQEADAFARVLNIFDGNNEEAVQNARHLWTSFKTANHEMHYWQQDQNGRWNEK